MDDAPVPHIYVDADDCAVKDEVFRVARRYSLRVTLGGKMRHGLAVRIGLAILAATAGCGPGRDGDSPHRVYAMLGFHSNFYHSWRGDTPDEAGFGTDIRLARFILDELDRAKRALVEVVAVLGYDKRSRAEEHRHAW